MDILSIVFWTMIGWFGSGFLSGSLILSFIYFIDNDEITVGDLVTGIGMGTLAGPLTIGVLFWGLIQEYTKRYRDVVVFKPKKRR